MSKLPRLLVAIATAAALVSACGDDEAPADGERVGECRCDDRSVCDEETGECIPTGCVSDDECAIGLICSSGECVPEPGCTSDAQCENGRCVEGACFAVECDDGDTRPCETACGDGVETCRSGLFADCSAPRPTAEEVCVDGLDNDCNGITDDGCETGGGCEENLEVCFDGLDNNCDGQIDEECPDCEDGDTRACASDCSDGLEVCADGVWGACSAKQPEEESCDGIDNDCDGAIDEELFLDCTTACGDGQQVCVDGAFGLCDAPTTCDCDDGDIDEQVCGNCGTRSRTCADGVWGAFGECEGQGVCSVGTAESEVCGPDSTLGICESGVSTRRCDTTCSWGEWSACEGAVYPAFDRCGDGIDQDCDGEDYVLDDDYEPNDSCDTAWPLGTDPDVLLFGTFPSADDTSDFFRFVAVDQTNFVTGEDIHIELDMSFLPATVDYDLFLYRDLEACRSGAALAFSTEAGNTSEVIHIDEQTAVDDGGEYYIEVRAFTGRACYSDYVLDVNGLNVPE